MERVLNLAGKNSGEIFQLRYPFSLLSFCDYDLSYFAENAIAVCDEALRSGELDFDRVTDLRNSLRNMHVYIEHNLRTVYEKIVLDCWIDYVCRRDNIGTSALWNRFIDCKTPFEKAVFVRLCEYRYNKGINEWLNLARVQDYAKNKVFFLFSKELSGVEEANARRNYFDLMFSVTAKELGCRLEDLGVTQVFSVGRLPSAPFMYPNISKDIIKNLLTDFDYSDDYSDIGSYESMSDQIAMDAFAHMKQGLPQELGSYNMSRSVMEHTPKKIYMPCGLKAAVDLEIDALLESGGWLARCKRCGRYYVRDSEYTEEYCSLPNPGGRTCLELYEMEHPRSRITPDIERQCNEITDEMYSRVTSGDMNLKEYESWKLYLEAMKEKVNNDEIPPEDLTSFIGYSRIMDISRSNPVMEVKKKDPERSQERVVKPFVPKRINRSELGQERKEKTEEQETVSQPQQRREGFFTSPSVERQKSQNKGQVSHIIRGGEPRNAEPIQSAGFVNRQDSEFNPFGGENNRTPELERAPVEERSSEYVKSAQKNGFVPFSGEMNPAPEPERAPVEERSSGLVKSAQESGFVPFSGEMNPAPEPDKTPGEDKLAKVSKQVQNIGNTNIERNYAQEPEPEWAVRNEDTTEKVRKPASETAERPRVIRKNAAAISAYGKIAGTPLMAQESGFEAISRPEDSKENRQKPMNTQPEEIDPFDGLESIFDILSLSENDMSQPMSSVFGDENAWEDSASRRENAEQNPDRDISSSESEGKRSNYGGNNRSNSVKTQDKPEIPNGIWTEERHLFPQEATQNTAGSTHEELNMLKEKKRGRSSKTQRLFDAIMREPDNNPNVRKK